MSRKSIKIREEVYEKLREFAKRNGSFSISDVIEELLEKQCTGGPQTNTSGGHMVEKTSFLPAEKLEQNTQQRDAEHYTITVSEDMYNALNMLRAWFVKATGRDVALEDVIGVLITYWTLRQTRQQYR